MRIKVITALQLHIVTMGFRFRGLAHQIIENAFALLSFLLLEFVGHDKKMINDKNILIL